MESTKLLKKQEKPLVVFLRFVGPQKARIEKVCKSHGLDPNDIGRTAIAHELHRLETLQGVPEEYRQLIAECQSLGLEPAPHLRALIADAAGGPN